MRVAVSSNGPDLGSAASTTFGRCPMYLFIDTESMRFEATTNPACNAAGGAGIQAAQFVIGADIQAIITGKVGPKAMNVIQAAQVPVYLFSEGTVRQAVEDFKAGKLPIATGSNAPEGQGKLAAGSGWPQEGSTTDPFSLDRNEEINALKSEMMGVRRRLTQVLERIHQLEEGS